MNKLKNTFLLGIAVLALGATVSASAQQAQDQAMPAKSGMERGAMTDKMRQKMHANMEKRMEKHRAELHDKLKLSAAQEPAWKSFTDAMKMHHEAKPAHDGKAEPALTAPAHVEKMLTRAKAKVEHIQSKLDALKAFYAVLSPEQQKIVDEAHHAMRSAMHKRMQKMHGQQRMRHMGESRGE